MSYRLALLVSLVSFNLFAGPAISPQRFARWVSGADQRPIDSSVRLKASRYHYIFISGFLNEWIPGYFASARAELRRLGVPRAHIHRFAPPSGRSFDYNAERLKEQVEGCVTHDGERVVIIAHSRGAVDALNFAIENPRFMRDSVEALFLVQGALKGSYLADYLEGEGKTVDGRMPQPFRTMGKLMSGALKSLERRLHDGIVGLTHRNMERYWREKRERNPEAAGIIGDKIFYVDSWRAPNRIAPILRTEGWYLQTYYGANDGEVMLDDMHLEWVGRRLATLDADHAGLMTSFPISNTSEASRRRFMRAIFRSVGQAEEPTSAISADAL